MQQTVVITDLTQMKDGNYVCITGINESGQCLRPVSENREKGIPKDLLFYKSKPIIYPKAKVEFDFHPVKLELPHVEDRGFDPSHIVSKGLCSNIEYETILRNNSYIKVVEIYNGLLKEYKYVRPGANTKSIATLARPKIVNINLSPTSVKPRLSFKDDTGQVFDCPVSDLTLWNLCYSSVKRHGHAIDKMEGELVSKLQRIDTVYLRLGLARPFKVTPATEPRCYLQVTGIYTFPDYLQGKTFADFLT